MPCVELDSLELSEYALEGEGLERSLVSCALPKDGSALVTVRQLGE